MTKTTTHRAVRDYVIIAPEYEKKVGILEVPDAFVEPAAPAGMDGNRGRAIAKHRIALSSRTAVGTVLSIGPGISRRVEPGEIDDPSEHWRPKVPLDDIKVGDRVLFERTSAAYLGDHQDDDNVIVRYEAVWLVLDPSVDVQTTQV